MALGDFIYAVRGFTEASGAKPKGNGNMSEDRLSELGIEGF